MSKSNHLSDEEITAGIKEGDLSVLKIVYKLYFPMILHFIAKNNGSEQEAKDIYQEAIINLYEKVKDSDFLLNCKVKTYIYSVCRRKWLKKLLEKSKNTGRVEDFEEFLEIEKEDSQAKDNEIRFNIMYKSLSRLGEPCRTILEDFYIRNLNMEMITEKFGYTNPDNAKNQKYKCLMRLKKMFFSAYNNQDNLDDHE
ncbi:sigma-70 family RNA polymerase sigma factor [Cytophagaceae bacterium ABcell3]|nr:sigma-70 family RNA polymerase sigma factor [Cytophagaceae bacterium ABcell3]